MNTTINWSTTLTPTALSVAISYYIHYHKPNTMTSTYHTYPDLVYDKGRLAETNWLTDQLNDAIQAIIITDPESIVLRARIGNETIKGLAPGGLA